MILQIYKNFNKSINRQGFFPEFLMIYNIASSYINFTRKNSILEAMSNIKMNAEEIEAMIDTKTREMQEHQNNAKYVEAEQCRVNIEKLKTNYVARLQYQLEESHRNEDAELEKTHQQEMQNFNKFWDKKMDDYYVDGQRLEKEMAERHMAELKNTRDDLERQLPLKLK